MGKLWDSGHKTREWEEHAINGSAGFKHEMIMRVSRLARDFMKLRRSILEVTHGGKTEQAELTAMQNQEFELCREGSVDTHAEMRQMDDMVVRSTPPSYVGVSKLCCARCGLAVEAVNIPTRGRHGRVFKQWPNPGFFYQRPEWLEAFLGAEVAEAYAKVPDGKKAEAQAFIQDGKSVIQVRDSQAKMLPDTSSSDEVFGLSGHEGSEIEEVGPNVVLKVVEVKRDAPEAYQNLRALEVSEEQIAGWYSESRKKFEALGSDEVQRLLSEEEPPSFEELIAVYEENPELFEYLIQDENGIVESSGFEAAAEYYRQALIEKERRWEVHSDYSGEEYNVDEKAKELRDSEEGWSLTEDSSDSENSYCYTH